MDRWGQARSKLERLGDWTCKEGAILVPLRPAPSAESWGPGEGGGVALIGSPAPGGSERAPPS